MTCISSKNVICGEVLSSAECMDDLRVDIFSRCLPCDVTSLVPSNLLVQRQSHSVESTADL